MSTNFYWLAKPQLTEEDLAAEVDGFYQAFMKGMSKEDFVERAKRMVASATGARILPTGKEEPSDHMDPDVHIGKRSAAGYGECKFTWAQEPDYVTGILLAEPDEKLVKDEYDHEYTGQEFHDMVQEYTHDIDSVGKWWF